jgi:hypothetical protein
MTDWVTNPDGQQLVHHSTIVELNLPSYRLQAAKGGTARASGSGTSGRDVEGKRQQKEVQSWKEGLEDRRGGVFSRQVVSPDTPARTGILIVAGGNSSWRWSLQHKFLILGEAVHSEVIEHQIREMLSGHRLSRLVVLKDEKTGAMATKTMATKTMTSDVIVSAIMSSTRSDINPENASRCFLVNADESGEQTARIHASQREKYTLQRYYERLHAIPRIIARHHAAQRLLRSLMVVNPFAEHLDFPRSLIRTRRDHERFVDLIACVCFA